MADWQKFCEDLPEKREVIDIANILGRPAYEVAILCLKVWKWAERHGAIEADPTNPKEMVCRVRIVSASCPPLDDFLMVPGFAEAMSSVGWLTIRTGHMTFPNFSRHNGPQARRRALDTSLKHVRRMSASGADNENSTLSLSNPSGPVSKRKRKTFEYPKSFLSFWSEYPLKAGKDAAYKAWLKARGKIADIEKVSDAQAEEKLISAAREFAESDKGRGEFCPHASTWLNGGRYDDDRKAWCERTSRAKADPRGNRAAMDAFLAKEDQA